MTIADILKRSNTRISDGEYWLVWSDENERWVIYKDTRLREKRVRVWFETTNESVAAQEFLKFTGYLED